MLLSHGKQAWAAVNASGSLCVGRGTDAGKDAVWCTPPGSPLRCSHANRVVVQSDGNLCVTNGSTSAWCARPHHRPHQGDYYAQLHNNCTLCLYKDNYPPPGSQPTWCSPGDCNRPLSLVLAPPWHTVEDSGPDSGSHRPGPLLRAGSETAGCSLGGWQLHGYDSGSRIADPQFVDPAARDFRLKPASPALAMGIRSLDVQSMVGPRVGYKKGGDADASVAAMVSRPLG